MFFLPAVVTEIINWGRGRVRFGVRFSELWLILLDFTISYINDNRNSINVYTRPFLKHADASSMKSTLYGCW